MADKRKAEPQGTSGEAIGRPGPWGENRYETKNQPLDQSVLTPPGTSPSVDKPESTPVTRRDYLRGSDKSEDKTPGGDAG
jgi:hypothetical protein